VKLQTKLPARLRQDFKQFKQLLKHFCPGFEIAVHCDWRSNLRLSNFIT